MVYVIQVLLTACEQDQDGIAVPSWSWWCHTPSAPYTRPTQRLSRPPPIQKLGAENRMLQLNIQCSWWWAYVPETRRAKNTSIKLPCCIKLAFQIISWGRRGSNNPQPTFNLVCLGSKYFLYALSYLPLHLEYLLSFFIKINLYVCVPRYIYWKKINSDWLYCSFCTLRTTPSSSVKATSMEHRAF